MRNQPDKLWRILDRYGSLLGMFAIGYIVAVIYRSMNYIGLWLSLGILLLAVITKRVSWAMVRRSGCNAAGRVARHPENGVVT